MAGLGKVIAFGRRHPRGTTLTEPVDGQYVPVESLDARLVATLNRLPARIVETPYGKLSVFLDEAIRQNHWHHFELMELVRAGRIAPKAAKLLRLLTTTQELGRRIKAVPYRHQKLIGERMIRAGMERNKTIMGGYPYELAAKAIKRGCNVGVLLELLEAGLTSLCNDPEPLSKKQAQIKLRKHAVLSIWHAFHRARKGSLDRDQLTAAARALAHYFPADAGLAGLKASTVRDIIRTRN